VHTRSRGDTVSIDRSCCIPRCPRKTASLRTRTNGKQQIRSQYNSLLIALRTIEKQHPELTYRTLPLPSLCLNISCNKRTVSVYALEARNAISSPSHLFGYLCLGGRPARLPAQKNLFRMTGASLVLQPWRFHLHWLLHQDAFNGLLCYISMFA
jgi:hypothetical protein